MVILPALSASIPHLQALHGPIRGPRARLPTAAEVTKTKRNPSKVSLPFFPLKQSLIEKSTRVVAILEALLLLNLQIIEFSLESHSPPIVARSLPTANG